jgi:hypothetical protein
MEANYSDKDAETWTPLARAAEAVLTKMLERQVRRLARSAFRMSRKHMAASTNSRTAHMIKKMRSASLIGPDINLVPIPRLRRLKPKTRCVHPYRPSVSSGANHASSMAMTTSEGSSTPQTPLATPSAYACQRVMRPPQLSILIGDKQPCRICYLSDEVFHALIPHTRWRITSGVDGGDATERPDPGIVCYPRSLRIRCAGDRAPGWHRAGNVLRRAQGRGDRRTAGACSGRSA